MLVAQHRWQAWWHSGQILRMTESSNPTSWRSPANWIFHWPVSRLSIALVWPRVETRAGSRDQSRARYIIIEMCYNEDAGLTPDDAVKRMHKQSWFTCLSSDISAVGSVILIAQSCYREVASNMRKQKKKDEDVGQLIQESAWTGEVARIVREELGIDMVIFGVPAEEIYVGFTRDDKDELWKDEAACGSYKDHGVDYSEDCNPALWCDAEHSSESGADRHFRFLVEALKQCFGDFSDSLSCRSRLKLHFGDCSS